VKAVKDEADSFAEFMRPTITRLRKEGMSVNAIADELNLHKFKTQRGGKWYGKTVSNIMARWEE
jgi:IS30 family transposase